MRYCVTVANFGPGVDAGVLAGWAADAEAAGWDGFFVWDHLFAFDDGPIDVVDPWMALAVAADRTSRIRLGTLVTPLPRRRPVKLARETVTLDRLSGGRAVLGVGMGGFPFEWDYLGEEPDLPARGRMLDEHLELLARLWTGEPVVHRGEHYRVGPDEGAPPWAAVAYPPPVQRPRIPVWVAGTWPGTRPFRRAARWDGVVPMRVEGAWTPRDTRDVHAYVARHREPSAGPFDLVVPGESPPGGAVDAAAPHAEAGGTWWQENVIPWRYGWSAGDPLPAARMRERILAGP
ncbi:LLM class flavin-dependent oxidoreductase [Actinotalea ferrariae]|uniref:LLM class flavin-dependent oxidoreductase n=1 Tax=Actinotalea ferrariae TaxID=1386098 RepID=UPI001C8B4FA6|nr:LLM class flavin-dependent oxidoreductase [Actinotalea ferrariae]MBX9243985.1 LLM class flavin-dependent oxidoreductase [Actinotalea ferrariae]